MKKHISKIILSFSLAFFIWGFIYLIDTIHAWNKIPDAKILNIILLFTSSGLFLGLYSIIDLLERK